MRQRKRLDRWGALLASTALLSFTATCNSSDVGANCSSLPAGLDSDHDGLTDDVECALGSDRFNADSDGDGLQDGIEYNYPKICVAQDHAAQRRPVASCTTDGECLPGETCNGLDPKSSDSDGDGLADNLEDRNLNGTVELSAGETDPRLWDTDGNPCRTFGGSRRCGCVVV